MYQEYPKALYKNGDYKEVKSVEDEESAREEGYTDWHSDHARVNGEEKPEAPRRGRPPKAKE